MARKVFERYFTEADERALFKMVSSFSDMFARRDYAWMRLLRQTGIRAGTLAGLNVHDAKQGLANKKLLLPPDITKLKQGGSVFLTRKARQALRDLLKIRKELGYADNPDDPLIYSRKHRRMSIRSYEDRTRKWCQLAGLKVKGSPHWFRHTLAKRLMKNSTAADPRGVVQVALGHSAITSTGIYTQPDREDIEQAMEEVS